MEFITLMLIFAPLFSKQVWQSVLVLVTGAILAPVLPQLLQFHLRNIRTGKQVQRAKSALNNLRLLIQPFIFWCLLQPWLQVFPIPGLKRGFFKLMACLNDFRTAPITYAQLNSA
jgi:hypothetical protein